MNKVGRLIHLSDMAISNLHGGGLTIRQMLESGGRGFDLFIHTSRFALEKPSAPAFSSPRLDLIPLEDRLPKRPVATHVRLNPGLISDFSSRLIMSF